MKKLMRLLFVIFGMLIAFQSSTIVKADGRFDITKYHVNVDVQKNGDIDLTQRITYNFDGEFHGVFYNQDLRGIKGASKPKVYYQEAYGKKKEIFEDPTGKNDSFEISKDKNLMNLKVYHYVIANDVTYTYKYKLYGGITNYLDTAELNWKIIGDGWENELNNVRITVNLPQKNISQMQAWTHGSLAGYTKVDRKNGRVTMTMKHNPPNEFVESHIIFPTSVTPLNKNVVKKNVKASIQAHEKNLTQQANAKRRNQKVIYIGLMTFGVLVILIIYLYQFRDLKKHPANKHVIPTPLYHLFDEPDMLPSMAQVVLERYSKGQSLGMMADLMVEVGHRRMRIDKNGSTYDITALVPPTNKFFKYLINDVGDGKTVSMRKIRADAKNNDNVVNEFDNWADEAVKDRKKYFDQRNIDIVSNFRGAAIATTIILAIMFAITAIMHYSLLISGLIFGGMALLSWINHFVMKKRITPYTDLGEEEVNKIRAFKRMLEDIEDIKLAEVGDLILWESFLPYAVVFGVSDKVIRAMKVNFGAEAINNSQIAYFYVGSSTFFNKTVGFQSSFMNSLGAGGSSSISGGSGGFSGGSSGGFGGGSGGGAF